jgi:hypothetical protein
VSEIETKREREREREKKNHLIHFSSFLRCTASKLIEEKKSKIKKKLKFQTFQNLTQKSES